MLRSHIPQHIETGYVILDTLDDIILGVSLTLADAESAIVNGYLNAGGKITYRNTNGIVTFISGKDCVGILREFSVIKTSFFG